MSAELPRVSPELEGLLREVAADPRATMLAIPPAKAVRIAFGERAELSANATGLLAAERELVRVHRAELAYLLRHACVARIFGMKGVDGYAMRHVTARVRHEVVPLPDLRSKLECELALGRGTEPERDVVTLVEDLALRRGLASVSVSQLASASARLEPSAQADVYTGMELALTGDLLVARRVFEGVVRRYDRTRAAAQAYSNLAQVHDRLDDLSATIGAYRAAIELDSTKLASALSLLVVALLAGEGETAVEAGRHIDASLSWNHPAIAEFLAAQATEGKRRVRQHREFVATLDRVEARLGSTSTRIVHDVR